MLTEVTVERVAAVGDVQMSLVRPSCEADCGQLKQSAVSCVQTWKNSLVVAYTRPTVFLVHVRRLIND